ncbi:MAG: cupin domain-containing protein [Gammaproteobacteria bacterium]|nr:cupin domain-containing protein [Gammaproteobacteria bacterium]
MQPTSLNEHPEGGRFQEVFRSQVRVTTGSGSERSALTHIYFSLAPGEVSRFHKVASDEVWNLYEGTGLRLHQWNEHSGVLSCIELGVHQREYCHVVPAGFWQAAEPLDEAALVGCTVGPGFEFDDFELINEDSELAARLLKLEPSMERFVRQAKP